MEVIFIAAIALIGATSFATASAPVALNVASTGPAAIGAAAPAEATMQVVTVSAKRMSAFEKAAQ